MAAHMECGNIDDEYKMNDSIQRGTEHGTRLMVARGVSGDDTNLSRIVGCDFKEEHSNTMAPQEKYHNIYLCKNL